MGIIFGDGVGAGVTVESCIGIAAGVAGLLDERVGTGVGETVAACSNRFSVRGVNDEPQATSMAGSVVINPKNKLRPIFFMTAGTDVAVPATRHNHHCLGIAWQDDA